MASSRLSRRGFLKLLGVAGASGGAAGLLGRLLPGGQVAGSGAAPAVEAAGSPAGRSFPAFVADAHSTGHLVHIVPVAWPQSAPPAEAPAPEPGRRWVMVIDLAKCNGCRTCTDACNAFHFVPAGQEWIKVYANQDNPGAGRYWFPRPCMQCDNPPCVKVCPVGATYKRADGIVIQDNERCIGCRYCIAACPYSARYFNWGQPLHTPEEHAQPYSIELQYPHRRGVVEKCIFCPSLAREGKLPACVAACPMGALYYGDENEDAVTNSQGETVRLSTMLAEGSAYRYLEELGTEPRVYYLPPRNRLYPPPPENQQG